MATPPQNKPRRTFTPEFKLGIVKKARAPEASISGIARKYNLNANQVFRWINEVQQNKVRWVLLATRTANPLALQQSPSSSFLPVTIDKASASNQPTLTSSPSPLATFDFANGHRLQLHQDNVELLKQLVTVML